MITLRKGSKGAEVKVLQSALKRAGRKITVDGSFGSATEQAVKDYQTFVLVTVDGIVGAETWRKLGELTEESDAEAIAETLAKCLDAVDALDEFRALEDLLYG